MSRILLARVTILRADGTSDTTLLMGDEPPDLAVVDSLARLTLLARRAGGRVRLEQVASSLEKLLALTGLRREVGGQRECGEDPVHVQEGVNSRDTVS